MADMPYRAFVFGNIRDAPHMADWLAKIDLDRLNDHGALIGTNEMWNRPDELAETMNPRRWEHIAERGKSPAISLFKGVYRIGSTGFAPLHDALVGVSDDRQIAWARAFEKISSIRFEVQVAHYTPSAFSNRFSGQKREAIRDQWELGRRRQLARIRTLIRQDIPVLAMGDFNHKGYSLGTTIEGQRARYVIAPNKIDKMIFVNSPSYRWAIKAGSKETFPLKSDHDGMAIRARLVRR